MEAEKENLYFDAGAYGVKANRPEYVAVGIGKLAPGLAAVSGSSERTVVRFINVTSSTLPYVNWTEKRKCCRPQFQTVLF